MLNRFVLFRDNEPKYEVNEDVYTQLRKARLNEYTFSLTEIEFFLTGIIPVTYEWYQFCHLYGYDDLDELKYQVWKRIRNREIKMPTGDDTTFMVFTDNACDDCLDTSVACLRGHIICLRYLIEKGSCLYASLFHNAIDRGNLNVVKYLHQRGCTWDRTVTVRAASAGNLECLRYLHENGCPWDVGVIRSASTQQCLEYAIKNGCPNYYV